MSTFTVRCLLFGEARALFAQLSKGADHYDIVVPVGITSNELLDKLRALLPASGPANGLIDVSILAVNQEYVSLTTPCVINAGDEVALIPPVSGG